MRIYYYLFILLAIPLIINMIKKSGIEEGIEIGIKIGHEECELATGYPFEAIMSERIEPLCWKILTEKYDGKDK